MRRATVRPTVTCRRLLRSQQSTHTLTPNYHRLMWTHACARKGKFAIGPRAANCDCALAAFGFYATIASARKFIATVDAHCLSPASRISVMARAVTIIIWRSISHSVLANFAFDLHTELVVTRFLLTRTHATRTFFQLSLACCCADVVAIVEVPPQKVQIACLVRMCAHVQC